MSKLQNFLDKIYNDGVKKAENKANLIISEAEDKANLIISEAEDKAKNIINQSLVESKKNEEKSNLVIKQIARDITLALENDILKRIKNCINFSVKKSMSEQDFIKNIIEKIIIYYTKNRSKAIDLKLIFSQNDIDEMTNFFTDKLKNDFKVNAEIFKDENIDAGIKINFENDSFYLDYSSNTLSDIICNFIEPKLAEIIKDK